MEVIEAKSGPGFDQATTMDLVCILTEMLRSAMEHERQTGTAPRVFSQTPQQTLTDPQLDVESHPYDGAAECNASKGADQDVDTRNIIRTDQL